MGVEMYSLFNFVFISSIMAFLDACVVLLHVTPQGTVDELLVYD